MTGRGGPVHRAPRLSKLSLYAGCAYLTALKLVAAPVVAVVPPAALLVVPPHALVLALCLALTLALSA